MIILGIETSCDETAASVVQDGTRILSHVVASSAEMHVKSGGIIPEQAARQQVKSIIPVIQEALKHTSPIDAVAVTIGPGLIGSLLVGVETAKTLSYVWKKPIMPVNHLVAHIYANWLTTDKWINRQVESGKKKSTHLPIYSSNIPNFPAIALVVSGGHTDLVLMKAHGKLEWLGGTRDDAAGEAFDKTARLLGLPYPGGPAIAAEAAKLKVQNSKSQTNPNSKIQIKLPRPMLDEKNFDFSFSGLKTAMLREVEKLKNAKQFNHLTIQQLSYEIQEAITDVLVTKTLRAVKKYHTPTLLLAGGVAANQRLTEKFKKEILDLNLDFDFRVPPPRLCTDNASYIAAYVEYNYKPIPWRKISANPGLTIMGKA